MTFFISKGTSRKWTWVVVDSLTITSDQNAIFPDNLNI